MKQLLKLHLVRLAIVWTIVCVFAGVAAAQTAAAVAPPVITGTPSVVTLVVMAVSLVVAFITQAKNTGVILGTIKVPAVVTPILSMIGAFLAASIGVIAQAGNFAATTDINAVIAGIYALLGLSAGVALHHHVDTGEKAASAAASAAKAAIVALFFLLCTGSATVSCVNGQLNPAVVQPSAQCVAGVISDALSGMTVAEIVAKEGPGCAVDAEQVIAIILDGKSTEKNPTLPATVAFRDASARRANAQRGH